MREIEAKHKEINSYKDYRLKDEDVDFIIKEKKRFQKDSRSYVERKLELMTAREKAIEDNDKALLAELDEQINELNDKSHDIDFKRKGNFNLLA